MIPRTVHLGQEVQISASFVDRDSNVVLAKNPSTGPTFLIKDPDQNIVEYGVAFYNEVDKQYHAEFTVPLNAKLSEDDSRWVVEWELIDSFDREYTFFETFDVINPFYNEADAKEMTKMTLTMSELHLTLPVVEHPEHIKFTLYDEYSQVVYNGTPVSSGTYSEFYTYMVNIPANTLKQGVYLGLFEFDGNTFSQVINAVDLWTLNRLTELRMMADKVMKSIDLYTGYHDSDLYFHLNNGLAYFNMLWVPTGFNLMEFKSSYSPLIFGLQVCGLHSLLRSQYLAEGDSAFDYSGQPVQLSVDRTGFIEAELGRLDQLLESTVKPAKIQAIKRAESVGHLGITIPTVGGMSNGIEQRMANHGISIFNPMIVRRG